MTPGPRIAFFGGSFDPPHLGHLAVARAARNALRLDTVLFAPVGTQPLKPGGAQAGFADRLEMTRLAIGNEPGFAVSLADAPRVDARPNYTLDTLRRLRYEMPGAGELFCLMGADSFANLRSWHGAAEIPFAASMVVASRPGQSLDELAALLPAGVHLVVPSGQAESDNPRKYDLCNSAGAGAAFYLLPGLDVPISATEIRAQLRTSRRTSLIPDAVAAYIRAHGLYQ